MVTIQPLGGHLGATVGGVDLSTPSDELAATLLTLLDEHLVLRFAGQTLDDAQQRDLMLTMGNGYIHPIGRTAGMTVAEASHIVDDADHPPYQDRWHTDVTWDPDRPTIGSLRAIEMPERGGDTLFASMYAAYDALSPTLKAMIEDLTARHGLGDSMSFITKAGAEVTAATATQFGDTHHPVVGTHERTGRRYLNVNQQFTESIDGLDPDESAALLRVLADHAESPNFQIRLSWDVGDVVIWDELATQHFAASDHYPSRREMVRFVVN